MKTLKELKMWVATQLEEADSCVTHNEWEEGMKGGKLETLRAVICQLALVEKAEQAQRRKERRKQRTCRELNMLSEKKRNQYETTAWVDRDGSVYRTSSR